MSFKYRLNVRAYDDAFEKLLFLSRGAYIRSERRWVSDILVRLVLSIVIDGSANIRHLVRVNYEDEDEGEEGDDDEVHRLLLMQKADTYVTAATSLISLSTSQSRAIHAYIDRFISR